MQKSFEIGKTEIDDFGGQIGVSQKKSKYRTSTYRTKLSLCQLNSMGGPLQFGYDIRI